jgi:hypothetical protein
MDGALVPVLSATKPRNGYFLRAESFFNLARLIDGGGIFAPDLSLYGDVPLHACDCDDLEAVRLTRGFLDAPARFVRATLGDEERE